jgi:hypothetical protein
MRKSITLIGLAAALLVLAAPAAAHGGPGHGFGFGFAGYRHGGGMPGGCRGGHGGTACANTIVSADVAASALGLTSAQLKAALSSGKTLAQEATATGKSLDTVSSSIVSAAQSALDSAVAGGSLSAAQAQAVLLGVPQQVAALVTNAVSGTCGLIKLDVSAAASVLGLTTAQLTTQLAAGKTIADLAAATGKTVTTLVQGLTSSSTSGVASAVSAGALTQAQGSTLTTAVTQSVTTLATKPLGG